MAVVSFLCVTLASSSLWIQGAFCSATRKCNRHSLTYKYLKKIILEKGKKKHRFVVLLIYAFIRCFLCVPDWGLNPQPWDVGRTLTIWPELICKYLMKLIINNAEEQFRKIGVKKNVLPTSLTNLHENSESLKSFLKVKTNPIKTTKNQIPKIPSSCILIQ